jgi:phosphatidylserine synthase
LIYCLCSIFRLIRFCAESRNAAADFNGLPIPASAGCLICFILIFYHANMTTPLFPLMILIIINSLLMISSIPYRHFSNMLQRISAPFKYSILLLTFGCLIMGNYYIALFILFFIYLIRNFADQVLFYFAEYPVAWRRGHRALSFPPALPSKARFAREARRARQAGISNDNF